MAQGNPCGLPLIPFHNRISTVINEGAGIQAQCQDKKRRHPSTSTYVIEEEDLFEAT